jgi:UDP-N-acetylglucosamine 2-epimerase (non-hydrolysing)
MNPVLQEIIADTYTSCTNLIVSPPMTHRECAAEIARCAAVITDSGGIQEEAAFMGKHIYCIRKKTERDAIPEHYIHT